jgi:hypothetical protein
MAPARSTATVAEAGERLLRHLDAKGLKPTTLGTYDSALGTHLRRPPLGDFQLRAVSPEQVEALLARMRNDGKAPKTTANSLTQLRTCLPETCKVGSKRLRRKPGLPFGCDRRGPRPVRVIARSSGLRSPTSPPIRSPCFFRHSPQ